MQKCITCSTINEDFSNTSCQACYGMWRWSIILHSRSTARPRPTTRVTCFLETWDIGSASHRMFKIWQMDRLTTLFSSGSAESPNTQTGISLTSWKPIAVWKASISGTPFFSCSPCLKSFRLHLWLVFGPQVGTGLCTRVFRCIYGLLEWIRSMSAAASNTEGNCSVNFYSYHQASI